MMMNQQRAQQENSGTAARMHGTGPAQGRDDGSVVWFHGLR